MFDTLWDAAHKLMPTDNGLAVAAGVACLMYGTMGIFGAARFGQATEGDCLVNTWLGGRREGWIDLFMALYLSISIPPMQVNPCICFCPPAPQLLDCMLTLLPLGEESEAAASVY